MRYKLLIPFCIILFLSTNAQENYYWIGSQGEWSNLENWNLENGIVPEDLPNETNSVYFNESSFTQAGDTVFLNSTNAVCKSMVWENIPFEVVFYGIVMDSELWLYGSLQFHTNVKNSFYGTVRFMSGEAENTISLNGNIFNLDVYFDGIGGEWNLMDEMTLFIDPQNYISSDIHLLNGTLNTNGQIVQCGSIISNYQNTRVLNIENSEIVLHKKEDYCWNMDMENMELFTENSSINIKGFLNDFVTKNGNDVTFNEIYLQGHFDSIQNINNHVQYNYIQVDSNFCCVDGNYTIGSLQINGQDFSLNGEPEIEYIRVENGQVIIPEGMSIGKIISDGYVVFKGSNHVEFAKLSNRAHFLGENVFDTLILTTSYYGDYNNSGIFYFQSDKSQTILDSLYMRGHPCENLTIRSSQFSNPAYIKKDYGEADISCDFLIINNVEAVSEELDFYGGSYTSFIPDPNNPTPGWTEGNAPGYIYGFGSGMTTEACIGDTVIITTENFNGNDSTLYYWNNDTIPGDDHFSVTENQSISIRVVYYPGCYIADYFVVEFDSCENSINDIDLQHNIRIYPIPSNGAITIETSNLTEEFEIIVTNLEGVAVFREFIKPKSLEFSKTLNLGFLNKGVYLLYLNINKRKLVRKIILY